MEIQLDRLWAHSEGCRRVDSNALPGGGRHGPRCLCDRERQYQSIREDDGDRIPRRGCGGSICAWSRCGTGTFRVTNPFTKEPTVFKAKPARKIVRARPVKA